LALQVARLPAGVPEREIAEEESANTSVLDNVAGTAHHHCGNAICFEVAGSQTHGLVADRSGRNQNRRIDTILAAYLEYLWGVAFGGKALAAKRWYCVKSAAELTHSPIGGRFLEPLERKIRVDIFG